MKRTAFVLSFCILAQLAACSSMQDAPAGAQADSNCREEATTGSLIAHKTCRPPMTEDDRLTSQRDLVQHGQPLPVMK
jgi:hypothetical protein